MKLEKVNDHQIRCTLTKADLADRHMKLSELAYGTDKAKSLFRDMMQQAAYEFGFEADDIPLMIEAIPLSGDCIVLIITKVEDPEELDTRFSSFAPGLDEDEPNDDISVHSSASVTAEDVIDMFKRLHSELAETASNIVSKSAAAKNGSKGASKNSIEISTADDIIRLFEFDTISEVIRLAHVVREYYDGCNTLYKCTNPDEYYLVVHKSEHTPEDFNKICNIISEYARAISGKKGHEAYFAEHGSIIIENSALQSLAQIEN